MNVRSLLTEMAKIVMALSIVVVAVVGWFVWTSHREASAPLPDLARPTGPCTLWFVGSSTMFKWQPTLMHDLAPWDARARGVNGASLPQITGRFGNEPAGPPPAAIVFYAGENDIAFGETASRTMRSFEDFVAAKTRRYGRLPMIVLSIKPSPTRWAQRQTQSRLNAMMRGFAARRDDMTFVDIRPLMVANGHLGPFYLDDGIHMNAIGYARWAAALRQTLHDRLPAATFRQCTGAART